MLFESLGQGLLFLLMLQIGICCGFIDEFFKIIPLYFRKLKNKQKHQKNVKNTQKTAKNDVKIDFSANFNKNNTQTPLNKKKKKLTLPPNLIANILGFFRTIFFGTTFILTTLAINYGEIRFYLILAFVGGFCIERTIIVKYVHKLLNKCYTKS